MLKLLLFPCSLETDITPPCCLIMPCEVASPRPVPLSACLVVKNGSNIWLKVFSSKQAGIAHHDEGVFAGTCVRCIFRGIILGNGNPGLNFQYASVSHGVPGVYGQIHEDLFQLCYIGFDHQRFRMQYQFQFHKFAYHVLDEFFKFQNYGVYIDDYNFKKLISAEGQELLCEIVRPDTCLMDMVQFYILWMFLSQGFHYAVA